MHDLEAVRAWYAEELRYVAAVKSWLHVDGCCLSRRELGA
jgi:hypothetical protein